MVYTFLSESTSKLKTKVYSRIFIILKHFQKTYFMKFCNLNILTSVQAMIHISIFSF